MVLPIQRCDDVACSIPAEVLGNTAKPSEKSPWQKWTDLFFDLFEKIAFVFSSAVPEGVRSHLPASLFSKVLKDETLADFGTSHEISKIAQANAFPVLHTSFAGVESTILPNPVSAINPGAFTKNIKNTPLILSNHDLGQNALCESVYELVEGAQSSILLMSFTFSDQRLIKLLNQKAAAGIEVQLVLDRDHLQDSKAFLHHAIKVGTRQTGEGHVHHKIVVVDRAYIKLSSFNRGKDQSLQCNHRLFCSK